MNYVEGLIDIPSLLFLVGMHSKFIVLIIIWKKGFVLILTAQLKVKFGVQLKYVLVCKENLTVLLLQIISERFADFLPAVCWVKFMYLLIGETYRNENCGML